MKEEHVTKAILKWLLEQGWEIVCFDFPQSGTGRFLHPNQADGSKNKKSINPDIVAVKGDTCLFFENKDRFYFPDFEKVHDLIVNDDYSEAISQLLAGKPVKKIYYGIGLPSCKHSRGSREAAWMVDFIVGVAEDRSVSLLHSISPDVLA